MVDGTLDLGPGVGGLAAAERAAGEAEHLGLAVDPLIDLGVQHDLCGVVAGEPGDDAAEHQVGLVVHRGEDADQQAPLELLQDRVALGQLGEQDHAARQGGGHDLRLARLAGHQAGHLLGVAEDQALDDAVGHRALVGEHFEARQLLAEHDRALDQLVKEPRHLGVEVDVLLVLLGGGDFVLFQEVFGVRPVAQVRDLQHGHTR